MRLSRPVPAAVAASMSKAGWRAWAAPLCALALAALVRADQTAQTIPFSQNWTNTGLITANDTWSGVAGIEGYLGQDMTAATGTDPQTLLGVSASGTDLDVIANLTVTTATNGGVGEFHTTSQTNPGPGADSVVALQGSGTADAPYLLLTLNTTGQTGINIAYNLRDIDCTTDNAIMPVALQYRVGSSGSFTNVAAGFVADATAGPSVCTLVTPVSVNLPAAVENQSVVQVRIMTTNAVGNDEWVGIDDISVTTVVVVDSAPSVASTTPADNSTGVAVNANLSVTFSEAVTAPAGAFSISCATSGAHTFVLSGGPTTFTLDPDSDFSQNEVCTVTVDDLQVSDVDVDDPPDTMVADHVFDFTTVDLSSCGTAFTGAYAIQGSGAASPMVAASVTTEGIVVGDFQGSSGLKGFYLQDASGDADPATSDGVFVFDGSTPAVSVAVGDRVRVTGTVSESFNNTQINPPTSVLVCSSGNGLPAPTAVDLPEAVNDDLERFENMLVVFPETLTVSGNFTLGRFGELVLSSDGRMFQQNTFDPTNSAAALAVAELNLRRYVVLDDGLSIQNPDPTPYTDVNSTRRLGDTTTGLQGVLTFDFSEYRVQPTTTPVFVSANPRTPAPSAVGGNVKVAAINVLNYFNGNGAGGGFPTSRGATSATEFTRQRNKVIAAIVAANADVNGIIEMENDGSGATSAIQDLVDGLNAVAGAGTYAFAEGVTPGTDEIKNSIVYKPGTVTPVGAALNDTDPIWTGQARNPLAQTFSVNGNGEKFVFIVNHFTSKGCSASDTGLDADQGDGQGCDNLQRTLQAEALLEFVEERQVTTGETRVLVMGDLNADGEEDPIVRLENDPNDTLVDGTGGLIDLAQAFVPAADRHSYQFGNRSGHIDHALSSKELSNFVTGATIWQINADEPVILDYNLEFKSPAQQALNVDTPYRSSDHDPVVVGLNLVAPAAPTVTTPTSASVTATTATLGGNVTSDGYSAITDRGVVYAPTATNNAPQIGGTGVTQVAASGTTGVFTVGATGLSPVTAYSFKAYATNAIGTSYSAVDSFTTLASMSIADAGGPEGYLSGSTMSFAVTLSAPAPGAVSVDWATLAGSAGAGSDYTAASGTLNFAAGESRKTIPVAILGDAIVEPNETFQVTLSNAAGATLARATADGVIVNDDGPTISVTDASVVEGTGAGTTNLVFTVITSQTSISPITVTYTTADGTATAGTDYTATAATLTIPAGAASLAVVVPVTHDALVEPNETVVFNLTASTVATLADTQGVGTIVADDGLLVSIGDKTSTEGNSGTTPITFKVTLNSAPAGAVSVDWATADGTATAPSDYVTANGTVTFAAGEVLKTVTVQIAGDAVQESYENFFVNLSNPTGGAAVGDGQGQGTITNTDGSTDRSRLMFHNFVTNRLYRWHMKNGNTLDTFNWVTPWATDPGWTVGAVADFDQDGQLDYLWHNVNDGRLLFWYVDGDNLKGFQFLPYVLDPGWAVATTFDANGDGAADIVYYDTRTPAASANSGGLAVFLHDNATVLGSYMLNQSLPVAGTVRVVSSVDVSNDGDDELIRYDSATGQVSAWEVSGATVGATINYPDAQVTSPAYNLVSTRTDLNNDGLPDLLWHNPSPTGIFSVWFMNGTTRTGVGVFQPFTATDPVWRLVGSTNIWP